jgi:hypothetical protein
MFICYFYVQVILDDSTSRRRAISTRIASQSNYETTITSLHQDEMLDTYVRPPYSTPLLVYKENADQPHVCFVENLLCYEEMLVLKNQ